MGNYFKIVSIMALIMMLVGCGDSSRRRSGRGRKPEPTLPSKDAKVVFVFPGGAGALRVSLNILLALEREIGGLDKYFDMVSGVSGGALLAAGVAHKINLSNFKSDLPGLLRSVFASFNQLGDKLLQEGFTLDELDAVYKEISSGSKTQLDLTPANINNTFVTVFKNAVKSSGKTAMSGKIGRLLDNTGGLKADIAGIVASINPIATTLTLRGEITRILGASTINDASNEKLITAAAENNQPVFFAHTSLQPFLNAARGDGATALEDALLAGAAVPQVLIAPAINIFRADGSGPNLIAVGGLKDGFFASSGGNDPSRLYFDVFKKQFSGKELVIIYVGNGALVDMKFRQEKFDMRTGVGQIEEGGKKITFVAIDAHIKDSKKENLFNLSQFFSNDDLYGYMDKASSDAEKSKAYKWTVKALKHMKE